MRNGKLPHSIARSLPTGEIEPNYAPDGLTEAAIDALIEQTDAEVTARPRPGWLSADHDEIRRSRRTARQILRTLPAEVGAWSPDVLTTTAIGGLSDRDTTAAVRALLLVTELDGEVA
jgi:hypothetical protein